VHFHSRDGAALQVDGVSRFSPVHYRLLRRLHQHRIGRNAFDTALSGTRSPPTFTQEQCRTSLPDYLPHNSPEVDVYGAVQDDVRRKVD